MLLAGIDLDALFGSTSGIGAVVSYRREGLVRGPECVERWPVAVDRGGRIMYSVRRSQVSQMMEIVFDDAATLVKNQPACLGAGILVRHTWAYSISWKAMISDGKVVVSYSYCFNLSSSRSRIFVRSNPNDLSILIL